MRKFNFFQVTLLIFMSCTLGLLQAQLAVTPIGTYDTGIVDEGAAETVTFDPVSNHLFFTNADANEVVILEHVGKFNFIFKSF